MSVKSNFSQNFSESSFNGFWQFLCLSFSGVSSLGQLFILINFFIDFIANNINLISNKSSDSLCPRNYLLSNFRFFQCSFDFCSKLWIFCLLISAFHFLNNSSSTLFSFELPLFLDIWILLVVLIQFNLFLLFILLFNRILIRINLWIWCILIFFWDDSIHWESTLWGTQLTLI